MVNPDKITNPVSWTDNRQGEDQNKIKRTNRPEGKPNAKKDFKTVIGGDKDEDSAAAAGVAASKKGKKIDASLEEAESLSTEEKPAPKPSDSASTLPKKMPINPQAQAQQFVAAAGQVQASTVSEQKTTQGTIKQKQQKEEVVAGEVKGRVDSSALSSQYVVGQVHGVVADVQNEEQVTHTINLQEIVDQILDNIYTLKVNGQTETVMTLRQPPIMEGSTLTLTSFDTARGQFNVTFSDLSAAAKDLIDNQMAQRTLQRALEEKGYTIHIVIVSTGSENLLTTLESQNSRESQQQREGEEGEAQQQGEEG